MGIIKKFLLLVLVIVAGGAALSYGSRFIPEGKLGGVKQAASQIQPFISSNIQHANLGQLAQYSGQIGSQVQAISGKVLGVQTAENTRSASGSSMASGSSSATLSAEVNQSLPQKTFQFVRYSYCKEVVNEYESRK